jgi:hypothetical protein
MHIYYEDLQWPRQFTRLYWSWVVKVWVSNGIRDPSSPHPELWIYGVTSALTNVKIFCLRITIARFKLKEIGGDLLQRWNTCFKLTVNTKSYPTVLYCLQLYLRQIYNDCYFTKLLHGCCQFVHWSFWFSSLRMKLHLLFKLTIFKNCLKIVGILVTTKLCGNLNL